MRARLLPDNLIVFHLPEDLTLRVEAITSQMYINMAIYKYDYPREKEIKRDDPSMTSAVLENHEEGSTRVTGTRAYGEGSVRLRWR